MNPYTEHRTHVRVHKTLTGLRAKPRLKERQGVELDMLLWPHLYLSMLMAPGHTSLEDKVSM